MKIELQEPYATRYRVAYLRRDKDGRGRVDLVNTKTDRTTISYARYLVEVSINDFIPEGYEVDHINADCSDDRLENLQILSREDHIAKSARENEGRTYVTLLCPCCNKEFLREKRFVNSSKKNIFCSRKCNGKFNFINNKGFIGNKTISEDDLNTIRKLAVEGLTGYKIAKVIGLSANTVRKYMKEFTPIPEQASTL